MNKLNIITLAIFAASYTNAKLLPQNGTVKLGDATISTQADNLTINQTSTHISIDWDSFDIGKNNSVEFKQPSDTAVAYNRVHSGNASEIQGKLSANGRVFLSNPNGVIFGKDAQVNVGALLATTKELTSIENLKEDNLKFNRVKHTNVKMEGKIVNNGKITVNGKNGFVVLVGDNVENNGEINAKHYSKTETVKEKRCYDDCYEDYWSGWTGKNPKYNEVEKQITTETLAQAILASGESFTLELNDSYVSVDLDANTLAGIVRNNGAIITENGYIELTAKGKEAALSNAINNNGLLQATEISKNSGKITLSANNIHLGIKSDIKAETELKFSSPEKRGEKSLRLHSEKGSKITAKKTTFDVDKKLAVSGEFERDNSNLYYKDEFGTQTNEFEIRLKGDLTVGKTGGNTGHFIQNSALSSMLNSSGKVTLALNEPNTDSDPIYFGKLNITDDIQLNSFKQADSYLKIFAANKVDISGNILSPTNRLNIGIQQTDFNTRKPQQIDQTIHITSPRINLGGGSFVAARTGKPAYYIDKEAHIEDEQRSYFDINLRNTQLENIGDFVVAGGFGRFNIDNVQHNGVMNLYVHGGNTRLYRKTPHWEYGFKNLDERINRTDKDNPRRRWKYSKAVDVGLGREFSDVFDMWTVQEKRTHLDTAINIRNSNITTHDGFIHLMAKNVNLENSKLNVYFDRNLSFDTFALAINKVGINAENARLDNSHIHIEGAEKNGVSPRANEGGGVAGFYFVGNMIGKNGSIFTKTHEGYAMHTEGNSTLKGESSEKDLKITAITTGAKPAWLEEDVDINVRNVAIGIGDTADTQTTLNNIDVTALAPNGGVAYINNAGTRLKVEGGKFTYFEHSREGLGKSLNEFNVPLKGNNINQVSERQAARLLDSIKGIHSTNLSSTQTVLPESNQRLNMPNQLVDNLTAKEGTSLEICENDNCTIQTFGDKQNAKVSVGEVK